MNGSSNSYRNEVLMAGPATIYNDYQEASREYPSAPLTQLLVAHSESERGDDGLLRYLSDRDAEKASPVRDDATVLSRRSSSSSSQVTYRRVVFTVLILMIGMGASAAMLILGIGSAQDVQRNNFERLADEFAGYLRKSPYIGI
jgi:hypothetical protein